MVQRFGIGDEEASFLCCRVKIGGRGSIGGECRTYTECSIKLHDVAISVDQVKIALFSSQKGCQ